MIVLTKTEGDDPQFLLIIEHLVLELIKRQKPQEIYAVQIDTWFDFKWLGFGATKGGECGRWNRELPVPRFRPNRVQQQEVWVCRESGGFHSVTKPAIHFKQLVEFHQTRLIRSITTSGLFVWYCGKTADTRNGCVMIYQIADPDVSGWYASFQNRNGWAIHRTDNIAKPLLQQWVQPAIEQHPKQATDYS